MIGYDVSERVVDLLNAGESHIQDVPSADVADVVKAGQLRGDDRRVAAARDGRDLDRRADAARQDARSRT